MAGRGSGTDDELARLLAAGERAAFHGSPGPAVATLQRAVALADQAGRSAEASAAGWLLGVSLGATGRYGDALTVLETLLEADAGADVVADRTPEQRLFASLAGSTAASIHRQLGDHALARELDTAALAQTDGQGEAAFDARLGLAADAVGLGDADTASTELQAAAALMAGRSDWWRQRVRLGWVTTEVALLTGEPEAAVAAAEASLERAETAGAPRHVAKSLLFLGVAQVEHGDVEEATTTLRRCGTLADNLGTLPLLWPARAMLGAILGQAAPAESATALATARTAVLSIAADLPEGRREAWLGRPDVAALLGAGDGAAGG